VKARQEAGGRRQEENNYGIKTGFSIMGIGKEEMPNKSSN
jgi:hypothetical protein